MHLKHRGDVYCQLCRQKLFYIIEALMENLVDIPARSRRRIFIVALLVIFIIGEFNPSVVSAERTVPIIYSTDLYHPPTDPDDHFDTAVLFAIREFDMPYILDNGLGRQVQPGTKAEFKHRIGRPPLEQLMQISGRQVGNTLQVFPNP